MVVAPVTVNVVAVVVPNLTAVAPVNSVPVIVTVVPPADGTGGRGEGGDGRQALELELRPPEVTVPPGVVIGDWHCARRVGRVLALMVVAPVTVNDVATVVPNLTAVAPVKLVPVMVTVVPPAMGPAVGVKLVMVGRPGTLNCGRGGDRSRPGL